MGNPYREYVVKGVWAVMIAGDLVARRLLRYAGCGE
jgi:hypothetical protein